IRFNPNDTSWGLKATSTATLCVLLETTNSLATANADLILTPTAGSPSVIATVPSVNNVTATLATANVSTYFRPGAQSGTFQPRLWSSLVTEYASCTGAWIEVIP